MAEAPDKDCYTLPDGDCVNPQCGLHYDFPSSGACLESMAYLVATLRPVVSTEILEHLAGVQKFIKVQYLKDMKEWRAK